MENRGRPKLFDKPMDGAERARRHRKRKKPFIYRSRWPRDFKFTGPVYYRPFAFALEMSLLFDAMFDGDKKHWMDCSDASQ